MAHAFTERLESIRSEFMAAKGALENALRASRPTVAAVPGVTIADIEAALRNVEDTYFLRLTAEAESICREHLARFPNVNVSPRSGNSDLIDKVARNLDPSNPKAKMPGHIADPARELLPHRNNQAHGHALSERRPSFLHALTVLNRFVFQLPA